MKTLLPYLRRQKKMQQTDLAVALNVSPSYVCKVEKGIQDPSKSFQEACAKYFNVKVEDVFPRKLSTTTLDNISTGLANNLWQTRQKKNIKQNELAKQLDCSPSYLSKIEKGKIEPPAEFRKELAKVLKVKEKDLFPNN